MFSELKFAIYAFKKNLRNAQELRTSFLLSIAGMMLNNSAFIFVWVYFTRTVGEIGGWTVADVIGLQGMTALTFGLIFGLGSGLQRLPFMVMNGQLDQYLLSPKNLLWRISFSRLSVPALGDIVFGVMCLVVYLLMINASLWQFLLLVALSFFASTAFMALVIIINSLSFYFANPQTLTHALLDMFFTPAIFHGGAFQGGLRFVFTFIVPSLVVGALPIEAVTNFSVSKSFLVIGLAIVWFIVAIKFFYYSLRRYTSANFFTFG